MPGGEDQFDRLHVLSPDFSGKRKTDRFSPRKLGDNKAPVFLRIPVADSLNELRTTEGQIAYVTGDGADDQGLYFRTDTDWTEAGGGTGAPTDASYVVLSSDPNLSNESTHASLTGTDLHDPATHGSTHISGGADSLDAQALANFTHASTHGDGGSDSLDAQALSNFSHGSTHQDGGTDELQVDTLSGDNGSDGQVLQTDGSALSLPVRPLHSLRYLYRFLYHLYQ